MRPSTAELQGSLLGLTDLSISNDIQYYSQRADLLVYYSLILGHLYYTLFARCIRMFDCAVIRGVVGQNIKI